ncbi:hypothetical protein L1N85_26785 [Paenibacillus alkaliterrae]|nr:hypothetical protein [Paenibacillus alkaliterrae]
MFTLRWSFGELDNIESGYVERLAVSHFLAGTGPGRLSLDRSWEYI